MQKNIFTYTVNATNQIERTLQVDDENEYDPEELVCDILEYYEIEIIELDMGANDCIISGTTLALLSDIIDDENIPPEAEIPLEISIEFHLIEPQIYLIASNSEYEYEESGYFYPEFTDEKFEGYALVVNENNESEYINIFDMEEMPEEELETRGIMAAIFGAAFSKLIKGVLIAGAALFLGNPPEFFVSGIESLCDSLEKIVSLGIGKVRHNFVKLAPVAMQIAEQIRQSNNKNIYYLAIPIIDENVHKYPNVESGDMLISEFPVAYSEAKRALWVGYSVYTFHKSDAYHIIKFAWENGYAKDEPCNRGFKQGYYSHYHPYYRINGELVKREVNVDGIQTSIHGFYGYPW